MVGERLRETRVGRSLSLTEVANKARISAATLSRIENGKQGLDLELFLLLARVLKVDASELLKSDGAGDGSGADPMAARIAAMLPADRVKVWRELAEKSRTSRGRRKQAAAAVVGQIDEMTAQLDLIREQLESFRTRLKKR